MTDQAGARKPTNFPWIRTTEEDLDVSAFGGFVAEYAAFTGSLLVGDQVFLPPGSAFTVSKSLVQAVYDTAVGVVVGGERLDMYEVAPYSPGLSVVEAPGDLVFVAWGGKVPVRAEGVISAGDIVGPSDAIVGAVVTPAPVSGRRAIALNDAANGFVTILLPYL